MGFVLDSRLKISDAAEKSNPNHCGEPYCSHTGPIFVTNKIFVAISGSKSLLFTIVLVQIITPIIPGHQNPILLYMQDRTFVASQLP